MAKAGEALITDGEQRASSFATYPIIDTLGGKGLPSNLQADGQYFAIFDDGHHRQLPRLTSGPLKYRNYAYDNFKKSIPYAQGHPMKQAVIAPSMLYLLYPLNGAVEGYAKEQFVEDLVNEVWERLAILMSLTDLPSAKKIFVAASKPEPNAFPLILPRVDWLPRKIHETLGRDLTC